MIDVSVTMQIQRAKQYRYWVIRWKDSTGRQRGTSIGRADGPNKLSRRQAETLRRRKQAELSNHPQRRDITRAPKLSEHLEYYQRVRGPDLSPRVLRDHGITGDLLQECFGKDRRIDQISRRGAREFKAALAAGRLSCRSKGGQPPTRWTVDRHIRQAKTIFNIAVKDHTLLENPFAGLTEVMKERQKWHYVDQAELRRMIEAASPGWGVWLALCRLAGLRLNEAVHLEWSDIDWERRTLSIGAKPGWKPKDHERRLVPICPDLHEILLAAYEAAEPSTSRILDGVPRYHPQQQIARIRRRAGLVDASKPFQILRKSCITDWTVKHPAPSVREWAGHSSIETTLQFYTKSSELEFQKAAGLLEENGAGVQNPVQNGKNFGVDTEAGEPIIGGNQVVR